jgi:hypothetical protein
VYAVRSNADGTQPIASPAPATTSGKVTTAPPTPPTSAPSSGSNGGGATKSGGTAGSAGGSTATTTKTPTVATHGKVDLSGFTALLPSGGGKLPAAHSTPRAESDPGFGDTLPFHGDAASASASGKDDPAALAGQALASSDDEGSNSSWLFLAAGLLVTVILMHVLWLRDEVNRDALPAVTPQDPAEPKPA